MVVLIARSRILTVFSSPKDMVNSCFGNRVEYCLAALDTLLECPRYGLASYAFFSLLILAVLSRHPSLSILEFDGIIERLGVWKVRLIRSLIRQCWEHIIPTIHFVFGFILGCLYLSFRAVSTQSSRYLKRYGPTVSVDLISVIARGNPL